MIEASRSDSDLRQWIESLSTRENLRCLGRELSSMGFSEAEAVSAESRSLLAFPREVLRSALLPGIPAVVTGSVAARWKLKRLEETNPAAATLFRLLTMGRAVSSEVVEHTVPASVAEALRKCAIAAEAGGEWRAILRVVPVYGRFVLTDFVRNRTALGNRYVQFGVDSAALSQMIVREGQARRRSLDLCTGGGLQAIVLAATSESVDASDINGRALAFASANAVLNQCDDRITFRKADLYDGSSGTYDLIVANPPFMFLPPGLAESNITGFGGELGIDVTLRILERLPAYLSRDGQAFIYTQGPTIGGRCQLIETARRRLAGTPLNLEFEEVLRGYWAPYREFYRERGVDWLTAYRVRVRRSSRFNLSVRALRGWRRAAVALGVALERWS